MYMYTQTNTHVHTQRAKVRFRGAREKGAMAFVEFLRVSKEDTMEGPLRRETLGWSLWSHDAAELVGGMYHDNGCRQETTRLHAILHKDGMELSHSQPVAPPGTGSIPSRE